MNKFYDIYKDSFTAIKDRQINIHTVSFRLQRKHDIRRNIVVSSRCRFRSVQGRRIMLSSKCTNPLQRFAHNSRPAEVVDASIFEQQRDEISAKRVTDLQKNKPNILQMVRISISLPNTVLVRKLVPLQRPCLLSTYCRLYLIIIYFHEVFLYESICVGFIGINT